MESIEQMPGYVQGFFIGCVKLLQRTAVRPLVLSSAEADLKTYRPNSSKKVTSESVLQMSQSNKVNSSASDFTATSRTQEKCRPGRGKELPP